MTAISLQAAAEYIGTTLSGVPARFGAGFHAVKGYVSDHPIAALGFVATLIVLIFLLSGRSRRG
jgi:hypothetical protein